MKTNPGKSNDMEAESLTFVIAIINKREDMKIKHRHILHT